MWVFALTYLWWFLFISQKHHTRPLKPRLSSWPAQCKKKSLCPLSVSSFSSQSLLKQDSSVLSACGNPLGQPDGMLGGGMRGGVAASRVVCYRGGVSCVTWGQQVHECVKSVNYTAIWIPLLTEETGHCQFTGVELLVYSLSSFAYCELITVIVWTWAVTNNYCINIYSASYFCD